MDLLKMLFGKSEFQKQFEEKKRLAYEAEMLKKADEIGKEEANNRAEALKQKRNRKRHPRKRSIRR